MSHRPSLRILTAAAAAVAGAVLLVLPSPAQAASQVRPPLGVERQ